MVQSFADVGDYAFFCQVHPDTMRGVVHVGTTTAPIVVPLSQQAYNNDEAAVLPAEAGVTFDKAKPKLSSVSAKRVAKGAARVRLRVSRTPTSASPSSAAVARSSPARCPAPARAR